MATVDDIGVPGQPATNLTAWQAAVRDYLAGLLTAEEVVAGENVTVDTLTTPGSVIINAPAATEGPQGPPGTAYLNAAWNFNQNTVVSPASGTMRMNATTYAATTELWVHETDRDGLSRVAGLDVAVPGDQIIMQSAQGRAVWDITGHADSGAYRTFTVTLVESVGTRPSASSPTTLYFVSAGGTSATPTRTTATITTASLASNATESGTVTLAPGYRLLRIATSVAARVRLYASTAARTGDLSRPVGTDPVGDHGVMLEMNLPVSDLDWGLSPLVDGYTDDATAAVPYAISNASGGAASVVVTLTWIATEGS